MLELKLPAAFTSNKPVPALGAQFLCPAWCSGVVRDQRELSV